MRKSSLRFRGEGRTSIGLEKYVRLSWPAACMPGIASSSLTAQ